jgi:hypothetical protein
MKILNIVLSIGVLCAFSLSDSAWAKGSTQTYYCQNTNGTFSSLVTCSTCCTPVSCETLTNPDLYYCSQLNHNTY